VLLTVNGQKAYAYTAGHTFDSSLPTVLFIHGAANDHSVWALQSRYFAYHGWNALAVDLPGHGRSEGEPLSSVGELAAWIGKLMDTAGVTRTALVGHSMGSLVALETATHDPDRISRVAMIGTAIPMPVTDALLSTSQANDHVAYEMINVYSHSARAQIGGNRVPGAWIMGSAIRLMERTGPGVLHTDFTACNDYENGLDAATKVKCPFLLVLGQRDLMTPPRSAAKAVENFVDAKTIVLDGTGHSLMSEQPDAVLDSLIEFLKVEQTAPA
jgi:pimeloyl-ACP methyl ester carboxylesterase